MGFKVGLVILALVCLCGAAPLEPRVEIDPELTAGFVEGDMVLQNGRNGLRSESFRWPNNIVYYNITEDFDEKHRNHILRGMKIIEDLSCIRFEQATADQPYYVNITGKPGGCYSTVGWWNTVQSYNLDIYPLDEGCFRLGTVVHEFLHTLGFYHMQSAPNRNEYVRIVEENIINGTAHNFVRYNDTVIDDFDEEYDYGSVMHYSAYAFSANGKMTIEPLKEKEKAYRIMGQRRGMSRRDINKLNTMYRCPIKV